MLAGMLGKAGAGEISNINDEHMDTNTLSVLQYNPECLLEVSIDNIFENNLIGKIINQDDSNRRDSSESLFLVIQTGDDKCSVTVTKLANLEPVFAFEFIN